MAQAQQIRSIILQNHESVWIMNQKFFEIKYINESKHSKYNMKLTIIKKIRETRTCSSSPRAASVLIFEVQNVARSYIWRLPRLDDNIIFLEEP